MPTYEYECSDCGYMFEVKQSITEPPVERCPQCNGRVKRIISGGTGFIMKGGMSSMGRSCSFEQTGTTCCGRSERCDSPRCGDRPYA